VFVFKDAKGSKDEKERRREMVAGFLFLVQVMKRMERRGKA